MGGRGKLLVRKTEDPSQDPSKQKRLRGEWGNGDRAVHDSQSLRGHGGKHDNCARGNCRN